MGVCTTNRRVAGASAHSRSFLAARITKASRDCSTPRGEPVANGVEQFPCLGRGDSALVAAFELGDPHGVGLDGALQPGVRDLQLGHGLEEPRHLRLKLRYASSSRDRAVPLGQQTGGEAQRQRQHHEPAKQPAPEMRSFPVSTIS